MAMLIVPPFHKIPPDATREDRERMFEEWKAELYRSNPHLCHHDGRRRSLWSCIAYLFGSRP